MSERVVVGGTSFDSMSFETAVAAVIDIALRREKPSPFVVTPNVDHVLHLAESPELRAIYSQASLSFADGMPVVWASRLQRTPLPCRISGADLLPALCAVATLKNMKVFLLGGPPGAADAAAQHLRKKHPGLQASSYYPSFGFDKHDDENESIIHVINSFRPDILFVGLGAPKQERWIARFRERLDVGISLGIGAAIEFEAGMIRRAPQWMQRSGLEWVWRLISDPKHLARRYALDALFVGVLWNSFRRGMNS